MKRIAIAGAGGMARVRARALLSTQNVEICGVAARHMGSAQKFGAEIGCAHCYDDYRRLIETRPDALLVEVPHEAQDPIVLWALEQGLHVLIGGTLATTSANGRKIDQLAREKGLVVEAGYEARYNPVWECARQMVTSGELGQLVTVRSIALWDGDPTTWYYNQQLSGGMPLTHMTYCFINPVRWVAGEVRAVSAFASRVLHTAPELIHEENVVANLLLDGGALYSLTAGFVAPRQLPAWSATFIGTRGAIEVCPTEGATATAVIYRGGAPEQRDFGANVLAFDAQARAFVNALDSANAGACRNTPADALGDVVTAEAVVASARERRVVTL
jgi:myo-inositol 2-dehydrogenase / D-chiro-inositol 1-dehydrogenase